MHPTAAPAWSNLLPLVIVGLVILRNSRARRLRIEAMWVAPVLIVLMIGLALYAEGAPTPLRLGMDLGGMAIGAGLGWWRARFTNISVDPVTHELTSRASPVGMLVILAVFAIRYGIRMYAADNAGALGQYGPPLADALLAMSVGLVCAQRLEIFLRASRLLREARANPAA